MNITRIKQKYCSRNLCRIVSQYETIQYRSKRLVNKLLLFLKPSGYLTFRQLIYLTTVKYNETRNDTRSLIGKTTINNNVLR